MNWYNKRYNMRDIGKEMPESDIVETIKLLQFVDVEGILKTMYQIISGSFR